MCRIKNSSHTYTTAVLCLRQQLPLRIEATGTLRQEAAVTAASGCDRSRAAVKRYDPGPERKERRSLSFHRACVERIAGGMLLRRGCRILKSGDVAKLSVLHCCCCCAAPWMGYRGDGVGLSVSAALVLLCMSGIEGRLYTYTNLVSRNDVLDSNHETQALIRSKCIHSCVRLSIAPPKRPVTLSNARETGNDTRLRIVTPTTSNIWCSLTLPCRPVKLLI